MMKNIFEILIAVGCAVGILKTLLRIIWLYFPSFLKNGRLYKIKEPDRVEKLLYFLESMLCMAYYIVQTIEKQW